MTTIKKPVKSEPKHEAPTPPQRTPVARKPDIESKAACDVCGTQLYKGDQCPVDGKVKE